MWVTSKVLENINHTLLVGHKATEFAIILGNFTIYLGMKSVMRVTRCLRTQSTPSLWGTRPQSLPSY
jgi:hypothetical protein